METKDDDNGYVEYVFPAGTFRAYNNDPYTFKQVIKEGDTCILDKIESDFNNGKCNGKK